MVKKVFAPQARSEKAAQIEVERRPADEIARELMATVFARQPALEADLFRFASGQ